MLGNRGLTVACVPPRKFNSVYVTCVPYEFQAMLLFQLNRFRWLALFHVGSDGHLTKGDLHMGRT